MKIILDQRNTVVQNAARYYDEAKKLRAKARGAVKAVFQTRKELEAGGTKQAENQLQLQTKKKQREWFSKFLFFHTSGGTLVVAGRNAKQNDLIFTKHSAPNELFLHADIRGSPAVVVKSANVTEQELKEAAQFTASYSSAWKRSFGSVDVYVVKVGQVSKHFHGGYLEQGAFAISGERQWFKNTLLKLRVCFDEEQGTYVIPEVHPSHPRFSISIVPGKLEKNAASKAIKLQLQKILFEAGKRLRIEDEEIVRLLPGGIEIER